MCDLICSVVIPVYNGAATIAGCLDALAAQSTPATSYELVVVDDGSRDESAVVVRRWQAAHPQIALRLLQQANAGPAAARNLGAAAAQASILLFTDADCRPSPDWIRLLVEALQQPAVAGVKGSYRSRQPEWVAQFIQAEYEDRYARMAGQPRIDFIDTYSAGYWRDLFLAVGGFDTRLIACEDQELSFRLAAQAQQLCFVPAAWVEHRHVTRVWAYARRKYTFGFWKARLTRWHPDRLVRDSHTPQTLKLQMALALGSLGLVLLTGGPSVVRGWARRGLLGTVLLFVGSALPFLLKLARRSPMLACVGLAMVVVRALALAGGFVMGTLRYGQESPQDRLGLGRIEPPLHRPREAAPHAPSARGV
ncbi:MAG TPA: glycosyltransferase [Caldilineaceae bacterium]|nr:glycosyltransferase [Caldilineaceae bacterium]